MKNLIFWQGVLRNKLQTSYPQGNVRVTSGSTRLAFGTLSGRLRDDKSRNASGSRVAREWLKYAAVFLLILTLSIGNAWGATITFNVKGAGSGTSYVGTETEYTSGSTKYKLRNWIPNTGQVRGNNNTQANNFYIYNTTAIPGTISGISISGGSYTFSNIKYDTGTSAITSHTTANTMSSASATISNGTGTFFRLNFLKGATSGTQCMTSVTITFCPNPTALTNGTITSNSAQLSWSDSYNTNSYEVYVSISSSTPAYNATPSATGGSGKSATVTGLDGSTTYNWWVRSKSSDTSKSQWVKGTSFTTTSSGNTCDLSAPSVTASEVRCTGADFTLSSIDGDSEADYVFLTPSSNAGSSSAPPTTGTIFQAIRMGAGTVTYPDDFYYLSGGTGSAPALTSGSSYYYWAASSNTDCGDDYGDYSTRQTITASPGMAITCNNTPNTGYCTISTTPTTACDEDEVAINFSWTSPHSDDDFVLEGYEFKNTSTNEDVDPNDIYYMDGEFLMPSFPITITAVISEKQHIHYDLTNVEAKSTNPCCFAISEDGLILEFDVAAGQEVDVANISVIEGTGGSAVDLSSYATWDGNDNSLTIDVSTRPGALKHFLDDIYITITACTNISAQTVTVGTVTPVYTTQWDATATWNSVSGASRYAVQLQDYNTSTSEWEVAVAGSWETTTTKTYTGLTEGVKYRFAVYAQNNTCTTSRTATAYSNEFIPRSSCPGFSFHYGNDGAPANEWTIECFGSAVSHVCQLTDFEIPSTTHFYVGYQGTYTAGNSSSTTAPNSSTLTWSSLYFDASIGDGSRPMVGQATGAVGTVKIIDNSDWTNKKASFIPNGYVLKFNTTEYPFTVHNGNEYRSSVLDYNSTSTDYAVSVGIEDADGDYVSTDNTQQMRHIFLNTGGSSLWSTGNATNFALYDDTEGHKYFTCLMVQVPGEDYLYEGWVPTNCTQIIICRMASSTLEWGDNNSNVWNYVVSQSLPSGKNLFTIQAWSTGSWSAYTKTGQFRMNANFTDKNWYVRFVPHYVLTYDKNNVGASGTMAEQTVAVDANNKNVTVASNGYTAPIGYHFNGWKTEPAGGTPYSAESSLALNADVTLYAQWAPNTNTPYVVKHYQQNLDGTYPSSPTETQNLTGTTGASVTPAVKDYSGFTAPSTQTVTILADGSLEVTYQYSRNSYTLTWVLGDGKVSTAGTHAAVNGTGTLSGLVLYGATVTTPVVTRTGYNFVSWSPSAPESPMPASDKTYTATWEIQSFNVTFDMQGHGSAVATQNINYNGLVTEPADPSASGYRFRGWYKEDSYTNLWDFANDQVTAATTLFAKWAEITYGEALAWCNIDFDIYDQAGTGTADIHLTSVKGVTVYATNASGNLITVKGSGLDGIGNSQNIKITYLDANNSDAEVAKAQSVFRLCKYNDGGSHTEDYNTADGTNIQINGVSSYDQTYSISYTPSDYGRTDHYKLKLELQNNNTEYKTVYLDLYGRSLPKEFVIAAKSGDTWYALPNTLAGSESAQTAISATPISVDDNDTPTKVTDPDGSVIYSACGQYTNANKAGLRFTNDNAHWLQVSTTSNKYQMWLSSTGGTNVQDWYLKSSDFEAYEVMMDPIGTPSDTRRIELYNSTGVRIGYHGALTGTGNIYFLPIEYTNSVETSIMEWGTDHVVIDLRDAGTATKVKTQVAGGALGEAQTLASVKKDEGVYRLALSLSSNNIAQELKLYFYNGSDALTGVASFVIPLLVNTSTTTATLNINKAIAAECDIVILNGGTLTVDYTENTQRTFRDLYIYGGGKLVVPADKYLTVDNVYMRGGHLNAAWVYQYSHPQLVLNGTLTNASNTINYDYLTNNSQFYSLALPYDVTLSGIVNPDFNNKQSWLIHGYDGALRASGSQVSGWYDVEEGSTEGDIDPLGPTDALTAGMGYTFFGAMQKVNGIRQKWSVNRFPMTLTSGSAEVAKPAVAVVAHGMTDGQLNSGVAPNDAGWNMLGNPYLADIGGNDDLETAITGTILSYHNEKVLDANNNWTGGWQWVENEENVRYVRIPNDAGTEYSQVRFKEATLKAFRHFFIQAATSGDFSIAIGYRAQSAPALRRTGGFVLPNEMDIDFRLAQGENKTNFGLTVNNDFSTAFVVGEDMPEGLEGSNMKAYTLIDETTRVTYNGLPVAAAEKLIPVGYRAIAEGEYIFSYKADGNADYIEHIWLTDMVKGNTTDLKVQSYTFETESGVFDERFMLNVVFNKNNTTTDIENELESESEQPQKFIYQDKMYIMYHGVIYDATGKNVTEINK